MDYHKTSSLKTGPAKIRVLRKNLSEEVAMGRTKLFCLFAAFILLAGVAAGPALAQEFEKGKIIQSVACLGAPGQSYALYLPSAFDPQEKWPVLYLFDPAARGVAGVEAFRDAAEDFGWMLVGSNNSRNGPLEASAYAAMELWSDTQKRLPVDEHCVYAGGFSGGARLASIFPQLIGRAVAGIIGCGAGLSSGLRTSDLTAGGYFGLTGLADFNYEEMKNLDLAFDPSGIPHRFLFVEGGHDWPDPRSCARAVGWLELTAMKAGFRPKVEATAEAVIDRELAEARSFEEAGRVFWAADMLEAARRLAEGLRDIPGLAARIESLRSRPEYGQFVSTESKRDKRAADFRALFGRAFGTVENETRSRVAVVMVLKELGIGSLQKEAKSKKTLEDRSLASRLLFDFSFAAQSRAMEFYSRGDLVRSAACLDLAIEACEEGLPREKSLYLNRACIAAEMGDKQRALEFLATAVDKGLSDVEVLDTTKALDSIRDTTRFREIMERARNRKSGQQ
jgi:predicted esterase